MRDVPADDLLWEEIAAQSKLELVIVANRVRVYRVRQRWKSDGCWCCR